MSDRDKSKEVERSESGETIDEEDNLNCCYVVDRCGCYFDPCRCTQV